MFILSEWLQKYTQGYDDGQAAQHSTQYTTHGVVLTYNCNMNIQLYEKARWNIFISGPQPSKLFPTY